MRTVRTTEHSARGKLLSWGLLATASFLHECATFPKSQVFPSSAHPPSPPANELPPATMLLLHSQRATYPFPESSGLCWEAASFWLPLWESSHPPTSQHWNQQSSTPNLSPSQSPKAPGADDEAPCLHSDTSEILQKQLPKPNSSSFLPDLLLLNSPLSQRMATPSWRELIPTL